MPEGSGRSARASSRDAEPRPTSYYEGHDLEALAHLENYARAILARFSPHVRGRALELGAGIGNFASMYVDMVDEAVLVEPAPNLFSTLRDRFADRGHVRAMPGYLDEVDLPPASFDAAIMVNVLEHIEDDRGTLERLYGLLRPGGALLLFVPANPWLYGSLDAEMLHVRRYTRRGLGAVVAEAGFSLEHVGFFDLLGIVPWLVVGRGLKRRRIDERAARAYDRLFVPWLSVLERAVDVPIGKNLVCIGRKPT